MAKEIIPVDLGDSTPDNTVGGFPDIPDDDYLFQVEDLESGEDDNNRTWYKITAFVVNDCPYKGTTFSEKFTFPADSQDEYSKKGRNRFHAWLLAVGFNTEKRKFGIDRSKVKGLRFWSRTYHHTMPESEDGRFKERSYSRMGAFSPADNEEASKRLSSKLPSKALRDDDDDDDIKPTKKKVRPVEDEDEDEKPVKRSKKVVEDDDDDDADELRKRRKAKAAAEDDDDDDEKPARRRKPAVDDDDDDDDEPKPAKKKKAAVDDDDDDDPEDLFPSKAKGNKTAASKIKEKPARRKRDDDDDDE